MGSLGRQHEPYTQFLPRPARKELNVPKLWVAKCLLSYYIFCANSVSPPHGDLHLIFIDDQIGSGENVWDDTCLPPEFSLA